MKKFPIYKVIAIYAAVILIFAGLGVKLAANKKKFVAPKFNTSSLTLNSINLNAPKVPTKVPIYSSWFKNIELGGFKLEEVRYSQTYVMLSGRQTLGLISPTYQIFYSPEVNEGTLMLTPKKFILAGITAPAALAAPVTKTLNGYLSANLRSVKVERAEINPGVLDLWISPK